MKRSFAIPLYVLMVFLSGALVGAVGYRLYSAKTVSATVAPKPKPEEWRKHVVEDMRTRLKLTDEQVSKLQAAFDATKQSFAEYDQRSKAERKSIIEAQHQTIRSFLSDEQRAGYDRFLQERQQKRRAEAQKKQQHGGN
jgi:uncharacterized membrane protein